MVEVRDASLKCVAGGQIFSLISMFNVGTESKQISQGTRPEVFTSFSIGKSPLLRRKNNEKNSRDVCFEILTRSGRLLTGDSLQLTGGN